jgi:ATP-binding cassette, subfamily B, bacterial MsbA
MIAKLLTGKFWAHYVAQKLDRVREGDVELFMRVFREYFRQFRKKYIIIFILIGIASITTAGVAWLVKDVVNNIFINNELDLIVPIFLAILAIFLVKGFSTYYQTVLSSQISNAMVADIQRRMFEHTLNQRVSFFQRYGSDRLLMCFNQGAQGFDSVLSIVLVNGARDLAMVIGLVGVMIAQDPILTVISLLVAPIIFFWVGIVLRKLKDVAQQELAGHSELNRHVREVVQGISVIKAFNLKSTLSGSMEDVVSALQWRKNRIAALQAIPIPLLDSLGGIAVGLAILYAGLRSAWGSYDPGTFMSFITALLMAADPARRLSRARVSLRTSFIAVQMAFDLLNDKETEVDGAKVLDRQRLTPPPCVDRSSVAPAIVFDNVSFSYDGSTPILDRFSLNVYPGDTIALVGPSGAGKSTVLKLLMGLYMPDDGELRIGGENITDLNLFSLRSNISFVGQSNFIFSGTIRENVTLRQGAVSEAELDHAFEVVGLRDFIEGLPNGYDTDAGELGSMISGGQAQRLNIARAIIKDAPILLLDEVTASLDAENEGRIRNFVESQARKKIVIIIAHRLSTIRKADKIALMSGGKVIELGPHNELIAKSKEYEKIVSLQYG